MSPKERKLMREWTAEDEIKLFDLICDFKPAGTNKHKHMVSIIENINRDLSNKEKLFTADQIWDKLESLYNLDRINNMEDSIDTKQAESESKTTDIPSSPPDEKKGPTEDTYSSELSDVEGELPSERDLVITKVESNQEDSSKNIDIRSSPVKKLRTRKSARDSNSSSTNIIDKIKNETNDTVNSSDGDTDDGTPRRITRGARKEEQKEEVGEYEKKLKEKSKDEQENEIEEPSAKEDEISEEESEVKPKKTAETKTKKEPDAKSKKDPDTKTKKDTDTNSKAEKQDDEIVINEEKVIDEEKEKNDGEAIDIEDNDDERDEKEKETAKDKSNEDESESEDEDGKDQEQSRPKKRTRSIAKLDGKEDSKSSPPATNSPNSSVTPGKRRRAASPAAASSTNAQTNNSSNSTPSTRRRTRSEVAHEQKEVEETGTGAEEVEEPDSESRPRATRRSTRSAASITPAKPSPAPIRRSNRKK